MYQKNATLNLYQILFLNILNLSPDNLKGFIAIYTFILLLRNLANRRFKISQNIKLKISKTFKVKQYLVYTVCTKLTYAALNLELFWEKFKIIDYASRVTAKDTLCVTIKTRKFLHQNLLKAGPSSSKKSYVICFIECLLKVMKNAF